MAEPKMPDRWRDSTFVAWCLLIRPLILFISCFGASVGAFNVTIATVPVNQGIHLAPIVYLLMLLGAGLLSAGLMIHNDYTDYASDCVNRPRKPLPRGIVSMAMARFWGILLMAGSVVVGAAISLPTTGRLNWPCAILTAAVVVIGIAYNRWGKHWGIWGHAMVAFGVGAIPVWGSWAVRPDSLAMMLPLGVAIFVMEIGREIMVCAGDIKGDIAAGYATTPIRLGRIPAMLVALGFYTAALPLYPIPYFGWLGFPILFGPLYMVGAVVFAGILYVTWILTFMVVRRGDDAAVWEAFERNIRLGTRLGVVAFQVILFLEAFL
ncbi:UbiA family prenyltransferase [bacterium]|nr:UbiA family prenyltransferase [candidate division CSSED10-310 bacterium]